MKPVLLSMYALCLYLPVSKLARRWRKFSRRIRGKACSFDQDRTLPEIHWSELTGSKMPSIYFAGKSNGNVRISELAILAGLAHRCSPGSLIFEIGTFDGRTTLNLAMNSPASCRVHTLDLLPDNPTEFELADGEAHMVRKEISGTRILEWAKWYPEQMEKIEQHYGDSATFDYSPFRDACSLVFVDGSHAYEYVLSDSRAAQKLVCPGGIVVWHDYGVWEGVTIGLDELYARRLPLRRIPGTSLVVLQTA